MIHYSEKLQAQRTSEEALVLEAHLGTSGNSGKNSLKSKGVSLKYVS